MSGKMAWKQMNKLKTKFLDEQTKDKIFTFLKW